MRIGLSLDFVMAVIPFGTSFGDKILVAQPVAMIESDRDVSLPPFFRLDQSLAQQLMDSMWNCGIRPTQGAGSTGAMTAVQAHLEDMRRLVFNDTKDK
jgi:hypothetical protein